MNIRDMWEQLLRWLRIRQPRFDIFGDVDELGLLRNDPEQEGSATGSDSGGRVLGEKIRR